MRSGCGRIRGEVRFELDVCEVPGLFTGFDDGISPGRKSGTEVEIGMCMGFVWTGLPE